MTVLQIPPSISSKTNFVAVIVLVTTLLDSAAVGILIPVMQLYFVQEAGFTVMQYGRARTLGGIAKLMGAVSMCVLSDKYGRKYPLVVSYAVSSVTYLCTALGTHYSAIIFAAQCLVGIGGNPRPICMSIMCDISEPESAFRARLISVTAGCFACGMIVGPMIGGIVTVYFSRSAAILIVACFQMSAAIVTLVCFTETLGLTKSTNAQGRQSARSSLVHSQHMESSLYGSVHYGSRFGAAVRHSEDDHRGMGTQPTLNFHEAQPARTHRTADEHGIIVSTSWIDRDSSNGSCHSFARRHAADGPFIAQTNRLMQRGRIYVVLARLMQSLAVQSVTLTYAFFIAANFTERNVTMTMSALMSGCAIILCASQIFGYSIAFEAFGPFATTHGALLLLSAGLILMQPFAEVSFYAHVLVTCALYSVGYGLSEAALPVAAAYFADTENQGTTQGAMAAMASVGKTISPLVYTTLYTYAPTTCFYVGGVVCLLGVGPSILSQRTYHRIKSLESTQIAKQKRETC